MSALTRMDNMINIRIYINPTYSEAEYLLWNIKHIDVTCVILSLGF